MACSATSASSISRDGRGSMSLVPMAPRKFPMTAMSGLKTFDDDGGGGGGGGGVASGDGLGCGSWDRATLDDPATMRTVKRKTNGRWTGRIDTSSRNKWS